VTLTPDAFAIPVAADPAAALAFLVSAGADVAIAEQPRRWLDAPPPKATPRPEPAPAPTAAPPMAAPAPAPGADHPARACADVPALLALADSVHKLAAVCVRCGADATRSYRTAAADDVVMVGGADKYEARCAACWTLGGVA
jgi:hypothetical protein